MRRRHQLPPRSEARWQDLVQGVCGGEVLRDRVIAVIGRSGDRRPLLAANTRECTRIRQTRSARNQLTESLLILFAYGPLSYCFSPAILGCLSSTPAPAAPG